MFMLIKEEKNKRRIKRKIGLNSFLRFSRKFFVNERDKKKQRIVVNELHCGKCLKYTLFTDIICYRNKKNRVPTVFYS